MSRTRYDVDHALAYPEPPASPPRHRHGPTARSLTHAAANLPLPDDLVAAPTHYGIHVGARRSNAPPVPTEHDRSGNCRLGR
ncbi:hypothetical protein [Streptomyces sp. XH2]|uniref:hypothetical protein n=1 Tax=Streptomyces sp. XH2 TaxID=3412483 RepID=UPI003C7DD871